MKKKTARRKVVRPARKSPHYKLYGISVVVLGCLVLGIFTNVAFKLVTYQHVLGVSTGFPQPGSSFGGSLPSISGIPPLPTGTTTNTGTNTNTSSNTIIVTQTPSNGNNVSTITSSTYVNCTGPDGKVFQTTVSDCKNINQQANHPVSFTVVGQPSQSPVHVTLPAQPGGIGTNPQQTAFEVPASTSSAKVDLRQSGTTLQFNNINGQLILNAKKADGSEVQVSTAALPSLNQALASENQPQIDQNAQGNFVILKSGVGATTTFPLSLDVSTNQLMVTTPTGTKNVTVLPDQAVNNLITQGTITSVDQNGNNSSQINLVEENGQPVFQINGVSDQKLLGIIPLTIHKTANVSAQTGQVVSQNESLGQQLLDLLSF